jgi:ABC-type nitrate/sulfonate/bicarbonate transport system substrate-binding protein
MPSVPTSSQPYRFAPTRRQCLSGGLAAALVATAAKPVRALDLLRVGKASATTFAFTPVEIGTEIGVWARHGLAVQSIGFSGDARMQQAMVANSIDLELGSGPGLGFIAKGVPVRGVAVLANEPLAMGLTVGRNSPIHRPEDLKGATVSISTVGSLTFWLSQELSRQMGWGPGGIKAIPIGVNAAHVAALKTGQVQGIITSSSIGYMLEKSGDGHVLVEFGKIVKDFHTHVISATNELMANRPDQLRRFLAGWIEVVDYMYGHRDDTIRMARAVSGLPEDIQAREYDNAMPMMSRDLHFKPKALEVLARTFTELAILPKTPDMKTLYTEEFLPR